MLKDMLDSLEKIKDDEEDTLAYLLTLFKKYDVNMNTIIVDKQDIINKVLEVVDNNDMLNTLFEYKKRRVLAKACIEDIYPHVIKLIPNYFQNVFNILLGPDYENHVIIYGFSSDKKSIRVKVDARMTKQISREYLENPSAFDFNKAKNISLDYGGDIRYYTYGSAATNLNNWLSSIITSYP